MAQKQKLLYFWRFLSMSWFKNHSSHRWRIFMNLLPRETTSFERIKLKWKRIDLENIAQQRILFLSNTKFVFIEVWEAFIFQNTFSDRTHPKINCRKNSNFQTKDIFSSSFTASYFKVFFSPLKILAFIYSFKKIREMNFNYFLKSEKIFRKNSGNKIYFSGPCLGKF